MIEDITKLKHAHENLERLASYDTLTGLPDRRMFRERLEHAVSLLNRHTQRLALLYLDLDNFKRVNDSLGHDIGDILLSKVAQRLTDCVRRDDTVARLGGDEFVILLQGVSEGFNVDALAHKILQQVKDPVMAAEALRLEITESLLMKDFSITRTLLERLREKLGTRVAIDDFGTGYSSLSYLKRLPIDTLKVDRSFVQDIPTDDNDMEITAAIIAMAQALKKDVVAEGIETRAQMDFLQARGCDFGQGYLFGRPVPPSRYLSELLIVQLPA